MICPTCKSNIRDDSAFCPVCGKPIPQNTPDLPHSGTAELPESHEEAAEHSHHPEALRQNVPGGESAEPADDQEKRSEESAVPRPASHEGKPVGFQTNEMPPRGTRPQQGGPAPERNAHPGQQGQGYRHQYRNIPPQGHPGRGQAPHPSGMNRPSENPLSERELFHLKHRLSIRAMMAFIFSIFGICGITMNLPCAIIALIMSIIVRNEYRDRGWQRDTDLKLANAAFICSIIGLVIGVIGLIVLMVTGAGLIAGLSALGSLASGGSGYYGF